MRKLVFIILMLILSSSIYADWAQFMGPNRNGVSDEKGLLRKWPSKGPKVLWTISMEEGYAGPAIYKGKIYMLDRKDEKDIFICYDLKNGKKLWDYKYDAEGTYSFPGSRTVPTIENDRAYVCGGFGHLHCIDLKTKKVIWKKHIWKDFDGTKLPPWGLSQHPLIYKDLLIVAPQTIRAGVVAYDKLTGKLKWKSEPLGKAGYVNPNIVKINGEDHLAMAAAASGSSSKKKKKNPKSSSAPYKGVVGLDPSNGKILWSYKGWQCIIPVPQVVDAGKNRLYVGAGYGAGCALFEVKKSGSKYSTKEIYKTMDYGTHIHPPIVYKDHFYAHCSDNKGRQDGMACMSIDGKVKWQTKKEPLFDKGGFILADDMLISLDGKQGMLYLTEPNPEGFKVLSKAQMLDTSKCWSPLALSDGMLIIRDQDQMKCLLLK